MRPHSTGLHLQPWPPRVLLSFDIHIWQKTAAQRGSAAWRGGLGDPWGALGEEGRKEGAVAGVQGPRAASGGPQQGNSPLGVGRLEAGQGLFAVSPGPLWECGGCTSIHPLSSGVTLTRAEPPWGPNLHMKGGPAEGPANSKEGVCDGGAPAEVSLVFSPRVTF